MFNPLGRRMTKQEEQELIRWAMAETGCKDERELIEKSLAAISGYLKTERS